MKACDAESRINALQVTEIEISNFPDHGTIVNATYALVDYDEKAKKVVHTHGRCTANTNNWSPETLDLIQELIESMETDLLPRHFAIQTNTLMEKRHDETRTTARGLEEDNQI